MSDDFPLRVRVQDVWNRVELQAPGFASAGEVKERALRASRVVRDPEGYVVKFRGAEVSDDTTLAEAGVVPNAELIVLPRRREPVR